MLDFVPVPKDEVTNCAYGGEDLKTLYVTTGSSLWRWIVVARTNHLIDSRAIGVDLATTMNRITRLISFESGGNKI